MEFHDAADKPEASYRHHPMDDMEPDLRDDDNEKSRALAREAVSRLLVILIESGNLRMDADCLAFVCGICFRQGKSGTDLAKKHGVSRAAFSKRAVELSERLGIVPSSNMKREEAREQYRLTNRRGNGA